MICHLFFRMGVSKCEMCIFQALAAAQRPPSRCQSPWRTPPRPGRDRRPARSPKTSHPTPAIRFPGRRRASRDRRPSRARRRGPALQRQRSNTRGLRRGPQHPSTRPRQPPRAPPRPGPRSPWAIPVFRRRRIVRAPSTMVPAPGLSDRRPLAGRPSEDRGLRDHRLSAVRDLVERNILLCRRRSLLRRSECRPGHLLDRDPVIPSAGPWDPATA